MKRTTSPTLARMAAAGLLFVGVAAALAAPAVAQDNPRGWVDATPFEGFATEEGEVVEVNLSGSMLRAVGNSFQSADPETKDALSKLHSVRALVVEIDPRRYDDAARAIENTAKSLLGRGWEEIAKVRSKGERVRVLALNDAGKIAGLAVMLIERGEDGGNPELVFANIAGTLEFSDIDRISESIHLRGLEDVELGDAGKPAGKGKTPAEQPKR